RVTLLVPDGAGVAAVVDVFAVLQQLLALRERRALGAAGGDTDHLRPDRVRVVAVGGDRGERDQDRGVVRLRQVGGLRGGAAVELLHTRADVLTRADRRGRLHALRQTLLERVFGVVEPVAVHEVPLLLGRGEALTHQRRDDLARLGVRDQDERVRVGFDQLRDLGGELGLGLVVELLVYHLAAAGAVDVGDLLGQTLPVGGLLGQDAQGGVTVGDDLLGARAALDHVGRGGAEVVLTELVTGEARPGVGRRDHDDPLVVQRLHDRLRRGAGRGADDRVHLLGDHRVGRGGDDVRLGRGA